MSDNKRIAKNTIFLYIRMVLVMLISLYTSRVVLNTLGATNYGIYNVVGGIVTMMGFINGALGVSTSRFLTYELGCGNLEKLKKTFSMSLNLHIGVALLVLILGETVGLWFFYEKLVIPEDRIDAAFWVYQFSIITTMVSFTQVPYNASLIAHENMSIYAYVGLYEAASKLVISYLITISPIDNLIFYALLLLINSFTIQMYYRYYTLHHYQECRFRWVKDKALFKRLISYSGSDLLGNIAVICQGQGLNILLNLFFGPVVNASRAIAVQIQNALTQFGTNFITAVRPQVVKNAAKGNFSEMYKLTFETAKYSFLLMLIFTIPLCFEIKYVLSLWLGDNYPEHTVAFTIIILISQQQDILRNSANMAYHAIGKIVRGNIVGGSLMILALPLSYIALKMGAQPEAVFIIVILTNFALHCFSWWNIHDYQPFKYKDLLRTTYLPCGIITIITVIPAILLTHYMESSFLRLVLVVLSSELVLFTLTYVVALSKTDRVKVVNLIRKKFQKI